MEDRRSIISRVRRLRDAGQLGHYMLFANRRLAGNADQLITGHIVKECNLPEASIYLCGIAQLELWLREFPKVAELANLDLPSSEGPVRHSECAAELA